MAREIDLDDMSDDDLLYISQRSWLVDEAMRVHGVDLKPKISQVLYGTDKVPAGPGKIITTESANPPADDEEPIDYEEWTKDQLVKEIQARNVDLDEDSQMSISGVKAELVARLRADDEVAASAE